MKLLYLILLSIAVYFLQFLILPFFNVHFNLFIPFALGFFICRKRVSRIIFIAVIFDIFSGLPFPVMTLSLALTFISLFILYTWVSEDSDLWKIAVILPISIILYWLFVYLVGLGLGLFKDYFSIPFNLIFDFSLIWSVIYSVMVGTVFYYIFKMLSPKSSIYV